MSHWYEKEFDFDAHLASIFDIDERARVRREFGLLEESTDGKIAFAPSFGTGPHAALNQAICGHTQEEYLHHTLNDPKLVAEALREAEVDRVGRTREALYMSRNEVQAIYDAAACLGQLYGLACNAFITISYGALGLADPEAETKLLTDFLDEAGGQLQRWGRPFHAIYVHENSQERGRHTHILATVDVEVKALFVNWARDSRKSFFWRHCGVATKEAVDIVVKGPRTQVTKALWQYDRVMYMTKGLDPEVMDRDTQTGQLVPLNLLLGLKEQWQKRPAGVIPYRHRVGTTQAIGYRARHRVMKAGMPVLSPFTDRAWRQLRLDSLGFGWELSEYAVRMAETAYRDRLLVVHESDEDFRLTLRNAEQGEGVLGYKERTALIRQVRETRQVALKHRHPYEWERPWTGWWYTDGRGLQKWGGKSAKEGLARLGLDWTQPRRSLLDTFER